MKGKQNRPQLEIIDTGVQLNPHHFFSLKNMFKSQLKVTNLLSPESKEFSNLSPIKG
ncbi:hypothetical protein [Legionella longbeachae]|uniref:hypothetical protein n=1 Tax=Legionella longbeachae TaxID=450 RepID=UPI00177CF5B1|nr:hypothetical protein [Legionella longbeachae]